MSKRIEKRGAGQPFIYAELRDWSESNWLDYFDFLDHFLYTDENSNEDWRVDSDKIKQMEVMAEQDNSPYQLFVDRLGCPEKTTKVEDFKTKFTTFRLTPFNFLKNYPSYVSPAMKEVVEKHPKLRDSIIQFNTILTETGIEIPNRNTDVLDGKQVTLPSLQAKVMSSFVRVADIVSVLADSINAQDIKKMDVKDRLAHLGKLLPILTTAGKQKLVSNHFTQINVNSSTKDIEKLMLESTKMKDSG
jgi:hypothetical protein